jgi:hypothetical protein
LIRARRSAPAPMRDFQRVSGTNRKATPLAAIIALT